jgi:hypothetical protein
MLLHDIPKSIFSKLAKVVLKLIIFMVNGFVEPSISSIQIIHPLDEGALNTTSNVGIKFAETNTSELLSIT